MGRKEIPRPCAPRAAPRASLGECLTAGLFAMVSLLSYQQLAAPYCSGQSHTLPPDSFVLHGYPCNGNALTRMLYIFRFSPLVLWDFCRVKFGDIWASTGLVMIWMRFFAAFLVPEPFYIQIIVPVTVYYARLVNTTFHVLQGPLYRPTYLGLQSIFSKHAPFDIAFFLSLLGVSRVNMFLELTCCTWAFIATVILWYWYSDLIPGVTLRGQIVTRLLVTLVNIYLDRLLHRRCRAAVTTASTAVSHASYSTSKAVQTVAEEKAAECDMGFSESKQGEQADTSGAALAEVMSGGAAALVPRRPYRSPFKRYVVQMKIPWGEPEKMQPRFEQRLQTLFEEDGLRLTGVYVRRGCVELTMIVEELERPQQPTALVHGGSEPRGVPRWQLDPVAVVEALGLNSNCRSSQRGPGTNHDAWGSGSISNASNSSNASYRFMETQQRLLPNVEREDGELISEIAQIGHEDRDGADHMRVTGLQPRVLMLPSAAAAAAGATSAAGSPTLRLSMRLGGVNSAVPLAGQQPEQVEADTAVDQDQAHEVEVLVRTQNTHLPVRVTMKEVRCSHKSSPAPLEREYQCDIELLSAPPRPGIVLLELRHIPRSSTGSATAAPASDIGAHYISPGSLRARGLRVTLPLLATHDDVVAAELATAISAFPPESVDELDELLCDIGSWMTVAGIAADEGIHEDPCSAMAVLGPHLLSYAEASGWTATAMRIREDIRRFRWEAAPMGPSLLDVMLQRRRTHASKMLSWQYPASGGAWRAGGDGGGGDSKSAANALANTVCGSDGKGLGKSWASLSSLPTPWLPLLSALKRAAGLQPCPPDEAAAFQAFADAWTDGLGHTSHVVECLVLLCLLARGRRDGLQPLGPEHVVALVGCGMGALATLAWLALPYGAWVRLVRMSKVPRLLGFCASKALLLAGLRPPSGATIYASGPGMLLMEGVILPGACLVSPRTAFLISCLKLPLNYQCNLAIGAARSSLSAFLISAGVELGALTTTLMCHLYLRCRFDRQSTAAAGSLRRGAHDGHAGSGLQSCSKHIGGNDYKTLELGKKSAKNDQ